MMRSVRRGSGWVLTGNIGYAACQYGILAAIARFGSATDVGRFALGLSVAAPITILTNLHLRAVLATDARGEHPFGAYLAVRLLGALVALAGTLIVCVVARYDSAALVIILLVAVAKAIESVADVVYGLLQQRERFRRIACSMLVKGLGTLAVVATILRFTGSLAMATLCMGALWGILLVTIDLSAARRLASLRPERSWNALASLFWLALPMGSVMCLSSLNVNVPRYMVESYSGPAALGYFAAMAYLMIAIAQPSIAFGVAASPRLAVAFARNPREFDGLSLRFVGQQLAVGVAAFVGVVIAGPRLLATAYGAQYAAYPDVLRTLGAATAVSFVSSALGYSITAARRFREQLLVAIVTLSVCVIASYLLVPSFGLLGAVWATLIAETARLCCLGWLYRVLRREPWQTTSGMEGVVPEAAEGVAAVG
jgi:O-antigen/teichoic acid export membrane protein